MQPKSEIEGYLIEEGAALILRYGSWITEKLAPNDHDLVALYRSKERRKNFELAHWDVTRLSIQELNQYIRTLDPVYATEPLLTGEVSYGSQWELDALRNTLFETELSQHTVHYNMSEALSEFQQARHLRQQERHACSLRSLTFCLSHWAVAWWYANGKRPTTINDVMTEYGVEALYGELRSQIQTIPTEEAPADVVKRLEQQVSNSIIGVENQGKSVRPK
ncbi:hypothetical protein [Halosimplex sp. TS25]|uniref:hypothetical protein n=1 Tax=Halosimplex rarum TaxID=3396619 RepID=UPI0039EB885D